MGTNLGDAKEPRRVAEAPVAQLVREHGDDLLGLALLDEGIIDDNVLLPRESEEVGIAVGAALASVDDVQLAERELQLLRQVLDARLERARLQRRQLVEKREDGDGIDRDHEELEASSEQPEVVEKLIARPLHDGEEGGQDGRGPGRR